MKLGEFIEKFSHNNIIRLHYKIKGGSDHEWMLDIDNEDYNLKISDINSFTSEELLEKYLNKEGVY